jgi:hypothetical protein
MAASKPATPACLRRPVQTRCRGGARWRSCAVRLGKKWCEEEKGETAGARPPFEAGAAARDVGEGAPAWGAAWRRGRGSNLGVLRGTGELKGGGGGTLTRGPRATIPGGGEI